MLPMSYKLAEQHRLSLLVASFPLPHEATKGNTLLPTRIFRP